MQRLKAIYKAQSSYKEEYHEPQGATIQTWWELEVPPPAPCPADTDTVSASPGNPPSAWTQAAATHAQGLLSTISYNTKAGQASSLDAESISLDDHTHTHTAAEKSNGCTLTLPNKTSGKELKEP
jgi:hypothetical protein